MNFARFKQQFQDRPFILSRDLMYTEDDPQVLRNQVTRWQKKGLLLSLRKGVYLFNALDRKIQVEPGMIANILYEPSCLSLEYALSFYGLIPERTVELTSVTTRKTMRIKNELGSFIYQHVKPQAFRGFKRMGEGKNSFLMAEAEKAVVDFLYLNLSRFKADPREVLESSYRFQNLEELNEKRLLELGTLFASKKLLRAIKALCRWKKEIEP